MCFRIMELVNEAINSLDAFAVMVDDHVHYGDRIPPHVFASFLPPATITGLLADGYYYWAAVVEGQERHIPKRPRANRQTGADEGEMSNGGGTSTTDPFKIRLGSSVTDINGSGRHSNTANIGDTRAVIRATLSRECPGTSDIPAATLSIVAEYWDQRNFSWCMQTSSGSCIVVPMESKGRYEYFRWLEDKECHSEKPVAYGLLEPLLANHPTKRTLNPVSDEHAGVQPPSKRARTMVSQSSNNCSNAQTVGQSKLRNPTPDMAPLETSHPNDDTTSNQGPHTDPQTLHDEIADMDKMQVDEEPTVEKFLTVGAHICASRGSADLQKPAVEALYARIRPNNAKRRATASTTTRSAKSGWGLFEGPRKEPMHRHMSKSLGSLGTCWGGTSIRRQATGSCKDALCVLTRAIAPTTTAAPATGTTVLLGATTTAESPSTTSEAEPQGAGIRVSVAQPSLCFESALQFSTSQAFPTGYIDIETETGWGDQGSIWNISANHGVQLSDLRVPCQGSACTGVNGQAPEQDGSITQNPDGSWSLNVTANMQSAVGIFGTASGGNPANGKYNLTITSTPPCALPLVKNCSTRTFDPSADQWKAYSTGPFLTNYLAKNNINSLSGILYTCVYPGHSLCDSTSPDSTAGYLVVAATIRMSQMLTLLYSTIDAAQGDMAGYITQIVVKFFQPQAEQKWQAIVSAVSSLVGLLAFIAIAIDIATEGSATAVLAALITGIQGSLSAAANFNLGFNKQKPDATYLAIDGNYTQSVMDYARGLEETVDNLWSNTELTQSGIAAALISGTWLDVPNPYNVTGIAEDARDWLDNLLVTSYINRVFDDADAFIVFLPYAKYVYSGIYGRTQIYDFTQANCESHWANDPSWPYYATCDVPLGGDRPGMAVVTRPTAEGTGSKAWTSGIEWNWASYTWDAHAMVSSTITGFAQHGFNFNLTNLDFGNILNKGSQAAIDTWKTLPLSTPGLFNLPVCVLTSIMEIPGGGIVATDSNSTVDGAKFCDNVSDAIKKDVGCP
ncbi:MAG: hypothetical protein Q9218_002130 [Villophora microphyllina]